MAIFDNMYAALGSPVLRHFNGDLAEVTYIAPDGTTTTDIEAIARLERWEAEMTLNGERRVLVKDFTIKTDSISEVHIKGKIVDSDSRTWNIRDVRSKSPTLIWVECTNRKAFEETIPNLRVPQ